MRLRAGRRPSADAEESHVRSGGQVPRPPSSAGFGLRATRHSSVLRLMVPDRARSIGASTFQPPPSVPPQRRQEGRRSPSSPRLKGPAKQPQRELSRRLPNRPTRHRLHRIVHRIPTRLASFPGIFAFFRLSHRPGERRPLAAWARCCTSARALVIPELLVEFGLANVPDPESRDHGRPIPELSR